MRAVTESLNYQNPVLIPGLVIKAAELKNLSCLEESGW